MTPVDVAAALESFQTPLDVRYVDGHTWIVLTEFVYVSPRITVRIPAGTETDFASVPRFFWRIISPTDKHIGKPALVHDHLYRQKHLHVTRQFADEELRHAMHSVGAPLWKRSVVYAGVRMFGGSAWVER